MSEAAVANARTKDRIPLAKPNLGPAELAAVEAVFKSGWVAGQGPACQRLEAKLREDCAQPYALAVANCTAALHLALLALGIGPGDEVVVSDYSFPASGHAVCFCGARPVFADVDPLTYATNAGFVRARLSPKTRAIIVVHPFGQMAEMAPLRALADERGLPLVEDAACAYGARDANGTEVGRLADVTCFSFHARKNATCGEGGALITPHRALYEKAKALAFFGIEPALARSRSAHFALPRFSLLGYNYKLSDIAAAIAYVQLLRLPRLLAQKARLAARYDALLADLPGITTPLTAKGARHTWQSYVLTLSPRSKRDAVIEAMRALGVEAQIGTYAMHRQKVYASPERCPNSAACQARHLALPLFVGMSKAQQTRVVEALASALAAQKEAR